MKSAPALVFSALAGLAVTPACYDGSFVGAECNVGLTECGGECVDLTTDNLNCGACGVACPGGRICHEGLYCEAFEPGTAGSGGTTGECVEPFVTAEHCGSCATSCPSTEPLCSCQGEDCECVAECNAPRVVCGTACVDRDVDPLNCGSCGFECASALCEDGVCVGAVPGNVVLMCTGFPQVRQYHPTTVLLGNAAFLAPLSVIRMMLYTEFADPGAQSRVVQALDWSADLHAKSYEAAFVQAAADVPQQLNVRDYQVLLVLDQPRAPAGQLAEIGESWRIAANDFLASGGTVIVLDGASGAGEMASFVTSAGLYELEGEALLPAQASLFVQAPSNAVCINVPSPFGPLGPACGFEVSQGPGPNSVYAVTDRPAGEELGAPFVVHRVVATN